MQWHQLDHMQTICTSLRQLTTPTSHHFRPDALPDAQPTVSKHRLSISCGFTSHLTQNSSLWRRFPKPNSWLGMKKQNLTQQKHAFTNQTKCTTTQTHTHTHTCLTAIFPEHPGEPVPERYNQSGFHSSKRQ